MWYLFDAGGNTHSWICHHPMSLYGTLHKLNALSLILVMSTKSRDKKLPVIQGFQTILKMILHLEWT